LGRNEENLLGDHQPWFSTEQQGNIGIGKAAVDVDAPTDVVWQQLLNFGKYPGKVPMVSKCEVYKRRKEGWSERIYVRFVTPVLLDCYKFQYFCDHTYEPSKNSITWSLDYSKYSDFEDVQGHWHVEPHPTKAAWSRVFYEVQLMAPTYLPKIVINFLTTKAIRDATTWVRAFSEKEAERMNLKRTPVPA